MLKMIDEVTKALAKEFKGRGVSPPEVFVAALRLGIAKRAIRRANGLILNFSSPEYAANLIKNLRLEIASGAFDQRTFACYIKIFYSKDEATAKSLSIEEFVHYDANPHYHDVCIHDGTANDILSASRSLSSVRSPEIPDSLYTTTAASPSVDQPQKLVDQIRHAGINLPCVSQY